MLLIFLAGVHAQIFHWTVYREVATWDDSGVLPAGAKVAGFRFDPVMGWHCCGGTVYRIRVTLLDSPCQPSSK